MVCGDLLLDHYQSLKDILKSVGKEALQVSATVGTNRRFFE